MWSTWIGALLVGACLGLSGNAEAALKPGDAAPDFSAPATIGGKAFMFSLADALRQGPVVLYFYPQAFTSGCTREAHDFAEAIDKYKALGATVVGVSGDGIETLGKFSSQECAGKFTLVSDDGRSVMKAYDSVLVPMTSYANRTSYVVTPDGRIYYEYTALDPDNHVANTLAALQKWRAGATSGTKAGG